MGCITYVREGHCSLMRRGLTLGIGDPTVSGLGLAVAVALEGSRDVLEFFLDVFLVANLWAHCTRAWLMEDLIRG